jgi:hypothetical protein
LPKTMWVAFGVGALAFMGAGLFRQKLEG